jgi:hypothetical protein
MVARNTAAARSLSLARSRKMFGRDAIGNGYNVTAEHSALVVSDSHYPESRFLDRFFLATIRFAADDPEDCLGDLGIRIENQLKIDEY